MTYIGSGDETDEIKFYITYTENGYLKYGICFDIDIRCKRESKSNGDKYINPHIIGIFNRINAAYLEATIKLHFNGREYLEINELSELLSQFRLHRDTISNPFE